MAKRPPQQTYYERSEAYAKQVSGEIIEQIKKGTAPWMKPWKPGEQIGATNVATGKAYTGGNSLYLMSRQISEGRGEKGTQVLFLPEPDGATGEGRGREDPQGQGRQNDL